MSRAVLHWFDQYGRKHLPWQQHVSPYRVWVSEVMLQQTQVTTVIPYFERFMAALPTVRALADADEEHVYHLWAGLGYYRRARYLHASARYVVDQWGGVFADTVAKLCALPGVGRSTAGAIVSIAFQKRAPILDGNVKRVLARYHGVRGWSGHHAVAKILWSYANDHTPDERCGDYSQAMMDLGATVCTRSEPNCAVCPLAAHCFAHARQQWAMYPEKKPVAKRPVRTVQVLLVENTNGEFFLQKRPPTGVWGGLWSVPEIGIHENVNDYCARFFGMSVIESRKLDSCRHTFSHYHLDMHPVHIKLAQSVPCVSVLCIMDAECIMDADNLWYNVKKPAIVGIAAPINRLLQTVHTYQA